MDTSQNTLSQQELDEVINQHRLWLETKGKEGQRADLSGYRLVGLNLSGANLRGAILEGVDLSRANLSGAYLEKTNLSGAYLEKTNLSGAYLGKTNLTSAYLSGAYLDNTDITTARNWQYALGINVPSITDNLSQKLQQQNQEIEQLKAELEAAKASEQADGQNTEEIKRLNDELEQKQNEQAETEKQLHQLQSENERYRLELESKNKILSNQINEAQKALAETFKDSADQQVQKHNKAAECVGQLAIFLICLDAVLIFIFLSIHWFGGKTPTSGWSLAVYSFPVLIILVLATTLLRHQKKLLDEVRHFAAVKQQIELYSGLLKASQHAAAHLNDPDKSAEYVQETFSQIRTKLLQHNFTAAPTDNKDGDTGSGVDKLTEKLLEKMADAISKSGKSTS